MNPETGAGIADGIDPARLQDVITDELASRRSEVERIDPRVAELTDELIGFVSAGGKRLRPRFLWCGWLAGCSETSSVLDVTASRVTLAVLRVAGALELIQACALVHDDVIDRSERRRGRPATHRAVAQRHARDGLAGDAEHYGVSVAVLLGDLALAWADDLFLAGAQSLGAVERALPVWRAMRTEVLAGQLLDLVVSATVSADPAREAADAMLVNRFKTAAYTVERPLELGATLAGASDDTVAALRRYGADVGVAFQLRDDLLGVYGDPAITGKPAGDDLAEGKRTLLLAKARAALAGRPELLAELDAGIGSTAADADRLGALIAATGAPEQLEVMITDLVNSGLAALDAVDHLGRRVVPAAARQRLRLLAAAVTDRDR